MSMEKTTYWPPSHDDASNEPKTLLSELKRRRENKAKFLEGMKTAEQELADLDRAIAALEPPAQHGELRDAPAAPETAHDFWKRVPTWANERWRDDKKLRDFVLNEKAVFHDGTPLTYSPDTYVDVYFDGDLLRSRLVGDFVWEGFECAYFVHGASSNSPDPAALRSAPPAASEESGDISFADFQKIAERMTSERRLMRMKDALNSSDQQTEHSALGYSSGNDQGDGLEALPGGVEESRDQSQDFTLLDPAVLRDEPEIPEGFTKWEGGYCPLEIGTEAEVLTRKCGTWHVTIKPEAPLLWEHEGHDLDIVGYRIIYTKAEPGKQHGVEAITIAPHVYTEGGHSITHEQPITVSAERADEPEGYAPVVDAGVEIEPPAVETILGGAAEFIRQGAGPVNEPPSAQIMGLYANGQLGWVETKRPTSELSDSHVGYYRLGMMKDYWQRGINDRAAGNSTLPFNPGSLSAELWADGYNGRRYLRDEHGCEPNPIDAAVEKGAITQDEADLLAAAKAELEEGSTARMFAQGMMADADRHQSDQRSIVEKIGGLFKREREDA